jgi:hypothetical protein
MVLASAAAATEVFAIMVAFVEVILTSTIAAIVELMGINLNWGCSKDISQSLYLLDVVPSGSTTTFYPSDYYRHAASYRSRNNQTPSMQPRTASHDIYLCHNPYLHQRVVGE